MDIKTLTYTVAEASYNCDTYGAGSYGECTAAAAENSTDPGSMLAETGYDVLLPLSLGLAIVIASAVLLVKKLRRRSH